MSNKELTVGDPIDCRCTKCRRITNHTIVAMANESPAKVACNTCQGEHKYRAPAVRKKPVSRRTIDPRIAEREQWVNLQSSVEEKKAVAYTMTTAFKVGSVMKHPVFGLGFVRTFLGPGKVEVLFEDGKKKMRCLY